MGRVSTGGRRVAKKAKKAAAADKELPSGSTFIISDEGEVVKPPSEEIWHEDLTRRPDNGYCKGCTKAEACLYTKIAAIAWCDNRVYPPNK